MFHHLEPQFIALCHDERRQRLTRRRVAPDPHDRFARNVDLGTEL